MRVSTPGLFNASLAQLLQQQSAVAKAQNDVSSGVRFRTAGEDPSGMAQALSLDQALSEHQQLAKNVGTLRQSLGTGENALASAQDVLSRVRELTVQANSAALDATNRRQIATELGQLKEQLVDIANTSDGAGHHVFGGTQDSRSPFTASGSTVSYAGSQTVRELAVGEGRSMAEGDSGDAVFLRIASATGTPRDLFSRVQDAIDATLADQSTDAARSDSQTRFASVLQSLDEGIDHLSTVRASVGTRLARLDDTESRLEGIDTEMKKTLSAVRDLDYAESVSRLQLHTLALQAAQASFAKVQGLSLFNYLR